MSARLEGKSVIVTGAGRGIGALVAQYCANEGAFVACVSRNVDQVRDVAEGIVRKGGRAAALQTDVTDYEACREMSSEVLERAGRIDGLFANAGIHGAGSAADIDLDVWRRVIEVNLTGTFQSLKAVLPAMIEQGAGSIVMTASNSATNGIPGTVAYSAAKAGLVGLALQMGVEYAPTGIRVNCLSPGAVQTDLLADFYAARAARRGSDPAQDLRDTASRYPMRRIAQMSDVAHAALFLLSDESAFITGVNIPIDGGYSAS